LIRWLFRKKKESGQDVQQDDVEIAGGGEEAGRHEKRIARQEEADQEPRLGKDDDEEAGVPAPADQLGDVVDRLEELLDEVHGRAIIRMHSPTRHSVHQWAVGKFLAKDGLRVPSGSRFRGR
jgi:hypothetical protein